MSVAKSSTHKAIGTALVAVAVLALAACSSSSKTPASSGTSTTVATTGGTAAATQTLHILVTNDDGYRAPGIDAVVQGLRTLPATEITVVAPFTNESGTGGRTIPGTPKVTSGTTQSGYPAKAVHGYPADTIRWAIDDHGVSTKPDLVVSGINFGQNIGPLVDVSGTVGAARAAASRGIPALAASAGLAPAGVKTPDYTEASKQVDAWVTSHRAAILAGHASSPILLQNLNVPTCRAGQTQRGLVNVPVATKVPNGTSYNSANCASTATNPSDDVVAFDEGFEPLSDLSVEPASGSGT
jgi:5'-nucleotidase